MYELVTTTRFRRDVCRLRKRGLDTQRLNEAYPHLIETGTLPPRYRAHPLRGEYDGHMDAHIAPDWVLIYEVRDEHTIVLHRTGRHQDMFSGY